MPLDVYKVLNNGEIVINRNPEFRMLDGEITHRTVNLRGKPRQTKTEMLKAAREARQARSLAKLKENSAITIQSFYRSFRCRQGELEKLRNEARELMESILLDKKKTKILRPDWLVGIIARIVATSRLAIDDELMSSLVNCIQTSKTLELLPNRRTLYAYFYLEITRYISFLCEEAAPFLGPSLRSLEKLTKIIPDSICDAAQLRFFSIIDQIIQKLLPADFAYQCDAYPTRAKIILDFVVQL